MVQVTGQNTKECVMEVRGPLSVHRSQMPTGADVPGTILDTLLEFAMLPLSALSDGTIFNMAGLINSLLLITSRSVHDFPFPFFSLSLFLYKLPLAPRPFPMHYWWGKCLSLSKNFTRSTFSRSVMLCLCLSLFPCSQSWEQAFCIMRRATESSAENRACMWHDRNLYGIIFIIEQNAKNARHLSQKCDPAASNKIRI